MIENRFDIPFIADLSLREKQIQQNYRPIIGVHKWFARRPGTLFRGLLLAEFVEGDLRQNFFKGHHLSGVKVADPFMGGGTPLIEANRVGCDTMGCDINPMAYWIVRQEIASLDPDAYRAGVRTLLRRLEDGVGALYKTRCEKCGSNGADVKYFIWVKTHVCKGCGHTFDLYPNYVLAKNRRHTHYVFICSHCGGLNERDDRRAPGRCSDCGKALQAKGPAGRGVCGCPDCGTRNTYFNPSGGAPEHRMIAIEYHCPKCKPTHRGRFFKVPDDDDLSKYQQAVTALSSMAAKYIPSDKIPAGDETDRLHRWGYSRYRELFNQRQLLGLELSCRIIAAENNDAVRDALATNLSDLLRYQNMLCRYDTMALKSLDIFSVHGFPVSLIQCESNLLGIRNSNGTIVGSGGWRNIADKYGRAKEYCDFPFETHHKGGRRIRVPIDGEWIGEHRSVQGLVEKKNVDLKCISATEVLIEPESLDAVFTDPPYYANVQYAELMDFCYVWLRRLVGGGDPAFTKPSTRDENELTGNQSMARGLDHFTEGLSSVFQRMSTALKPGAPFVFTYHHNTVEAYFPIAVALLDAGLTCSASIPCPAEMGASIHIKGTMSSVIDTIFVCRTTGTVARNTITDSPAGIAGLVRRDRDSLRRGNMNPTRGDLRCIAFGHLIRLAVWHLRADWDAGLKTDSKLRLIGRTVQELGGWAGVEECLSAVLAASDRLQSGVVSETTGVYGVVNDEISF